ncbi:MAG: phosphoribosyl-ATP diphosphatase [Spirochaetales bacterium]|nr:phosphoribosyl-ATP diphosphatase [Spirochaetales bacterium]
MSSDNKKLIIKDQDGNILDLVKTNEKGFNKSIENSALWVLDSETDRLLPYSDTSAFVSLVDRIHWYECVFEKKTAENSEKPQENVIFSGKNGENTSETAENAEKSSNFLQNLEKLIKDRHEKMPEGSYTTHLFKSGYEKIRKKTGEEAFELVLAKKREDIVYEAADLVYHMMVLLESENISFGEVVAELARREG